MKHKTLIVFLFSILLSTSSYAQEHAKFKGIPLDGPLNSFVEALKQQGYKQVKSTVNGLAVLTGTFAGNPEADIFVVSLNNMVWKIGVEFPEHDTWVSALQDYNTLKEFFCKKYGHNPKVSEQLPPNLKGEPDASYLNKTIMHDALENKTATWVSIFPIPNGVASLYIDSSLESSTRFVVSIEYLDTINTSLRDNSILNDI